MERGFLIGTLLSSIFVANAYDISVSALENNAELSAIIQEIQNKNALIEDVRRSPELGEEALQGALSALNIANVRHFLFKPICIPEKTKKPIASVGTPLNRK